MEWRRSIYLDIDNSEIKRIVCEILKNYQLTFTNSFADRHFDLVIQQKNKVEYIKNNDNNNKSILLTDINQLNSLPESTLYLFNDIILINELNVLLKYRVEKLLLDNQKSPIILQKGITLHCTHKYLKFNNNIIFLSNTEFLLMEYLLKTQGYINTNKIIELIKSEKNENLYNKASATVLINRLSKKIFKGFGIKMIKSRYGIGYYISI